MCDGQRPPLQDIVQTSEQMRNGLVGFVAHVGKAEGLTSEFAVAGIDDQVMLGSKVTCELQNIDSTIVFDAGERFRAESFFGEKFEAGPTYPIVHERVATGVPIEARIQPFLENLFQL